MGKIRELIKMGKTKCLNCKKEFDNVYIDTWNIKITNEDSYRHGHFPLCYKCSDEVEIYTVETIFESMKIILDMKKEVDKNES